MPKAISPSSQELDPDRYEHIFWIHGELSGALVGFCSANAPTSSARLAVKVVGAHGSLAEYMEHRNASKDRSKSVFFYG